MKLRQALYSLSLFSISPLSFSQDILTTTPVADIIARSLTQNTPISVNYVLPSRYGIRRIDSWLSNQGKVSFAEQAQNAQAIITLNRLWRKDTGFSHARASNIRIVEIDASQSLAPNGSAVATLGKENRDTSSYAWLNSANLSRMSKIVAGDLIKLWPEHSSVIEMNLSYTLQQCRTLIQQQNDRLMDHDIETVFLLAESLEDFAAGYQLFVSGKLYTPELDWNESDYAKLKVAIDANPTMYIATNRTPSEKLLSYVDKSRIIFVDSLERMGKHPFNSAQPFERWLIQH